MELYEDISIFIPHEEFELSFNLFFINYKFIINLKFLIIYIIYKSLIKKSVKKKISL